MSAAAAWAVTQSRTRRQNGNEVGARDNIEAVERGGRHRRSLALRGFYKTLTGPDLRAGDVRVLPKLARCQGVTHSMASSNVVNTPTADPST
jgi:hypothetical protein